MAIEDLPCTYTCAVPFELPHELGRVREEVGVQNLSDFVGRGDRW